MDFMRLEEEREQLIEDAITKCKNNEPFAVNLINNVTNEINEIARKGIVPQRKLVTKEMVVEFVKRRS
jgi:hypothetical protein